MNPSANAPKVSVLMPVLNGQLYIDEAIRSVLSQTYKNWELIIINDGSTDRTEDIIRIYLSDPRVRYIKQENRGLPAAKNAGISKARGEFIAFLDSDDFWLSNKLELQVEYLARHPEIAMLHSGCKILRGGKLYAQLKYFPFFAKNLKGFVYKKLLKENFICILTVILRREIFSEVGLFDEKLRGVDDWDLWLRISRRFKIGFLNKVLAVYRYNSSGMSKNIEKFGNTVREYIEKQILVIPEIDAVSRKMALSNFYTGVGDVYFWEGLFKKSEENALIGMGYCPFNYKPYRLYLKTFVTKTLKNAGNIFRF